MIKGGKILSIPTKEESPDGLHQRYDISKKDGDNDPDAEYFVLRIDGGGDDPIWQAACQDTLMFLAERVKQYMPKFTTTVRDKYLSLVESNYIKDPTYSPYCLRCSTMNRMEHTETGWKCNHCPAICDSIVKLADTSPPGALVDVNEIITILREAIERGKEVKGSNSDYELNGKTKVDCVRVGMEVAIDAIEDKYGN